MSSQTWSIQQAMGALQLQQPSQVPPDTAKPSTPHRIVLPLPKRVGVSKQHHILYGFEVSDEWLFEYCEQNAHRIRDYDPTRDSMYKIFLAIKLLAAASKIRNLTIETSLYRVSEPSLVLGGDDGCVTIVCVCSSVKSSYERRPTEAQLDKLRSIMKKEPDWFVDANPPGYFG
ncbi:hypothetical protein FPV67DRAFT_1669749 [Lyophyllum atratum]|nr:hypothetical protein FPV67DRAFT_1669749 [Lyophyllum atratum]